jgi:hypothetical protein
MECAEAYYDYEADGQGLDQDQKKWLRGWKKQFRGLIRGGEIVKQQRVWVTQQISDSSSEDSE